MRLSVTLVTFARGIIQAFFNLLPCVTAKAIPFAAANLAPNDPETSKEFRSQSQEK
jgi:hypothetical protein